MLLLEIVLYAGTLAAQDHIHESPWTESAYEVLLQ